MGIIKIKNLIYDYIKSDEEGNVDSAVLNASQAAAMSGMPTIG